MPIPSSAQLRFSSLRTYQSNNEADVADNVPDKLSILIEKLYAVGVGPTLMRQISPDLAKLSVNALGRRIHDMGLPKSYPEAAQKILEDGIKRAQETIGEQVRARAEDNASVRKTIVTPSPVEPKKIVMPVTLKDIQQRQAAEKQRAIEAYVQKMQGEVVVDLPVADWPYQTTSDWRICFQQQLHAQGFKQVAYGAREDETPAMVHDYWWHTRGLLAEIQSGGPHLPVLKMQAQLINIDDTQPTLHVGSLGKVRGYRAEHFFLGGGREVAAVTLTTNGPNGVERAVEKQMKVIASALKNGNGNMLLTKHAVVPGHSKAAGLAYKHDATDVAQLPEVLRPYFDATLRSKQSRRKITI